MKVSGTMMGDIDIQGNHVHLCNSCVYLYPACPAEHTDIMFGDGEGKDNVCCCNKYNPIRSRDKDTKFKLEDIQFYIPEGLKIPTELMLKVGESVVRYKVISLTTFEFHFPGNEFTFDEASIAVKNIANLIETQSDNGVTKLVFKDIAISGPTSFKVYFGVLKY